ncbi:hypothetical protein LACDD01_00673 [Lactococcus sp. DD01]|nr:hypothetical protein LACDD01_00673 [Lactococcus sp. DD01]
MHPSANWCWIFPQTVINGLLVKGRKGKSAPNQANQYQKGDIAQSVFFICIHKLLLPSR